MFKSIQVFLVGFLAIGLMACGGGGGGNSLDAAVQNARSKGVNVTLVSIVPSNYEYCDNDLEGEPICFPAGETRNGREMTNISLRSVGPADQDMVAAIDALRAMDAAVDGSNLLNKDNAHMMIEDAIYTLQQKRKELLEKNNGGSSL